MVNNKSTRPYRDAETTLWHYYKAQPQENYLQLERPQRRLRVQVLGEGPPLLFLHGSPSCGTIWAALAAELSACYRCFLLDLPGFGLSEALDYRSGDIQALVTEIIDSTLDALALDQVSLVASSSGGAMAYWYAMARPQRVRRIVQLGAPFVLEGAPVHMSNRLLAVPRLNQFLIGVLPVNLKAMRSVYSQIGHGPAIEDGRIPACFLEWSVQLSAETDTMATTANLVEACMSWGGIRPEAIIDQAALARITQPTQYIWSEGDPDGDATVARETAKRTPNSELHLLPGNGHLPWLDAAGEVAALMYSFLQPVATDDKVKQGTQIR